MGREPAVLMTAAQESVAAGGGVFVVSQRHQFRADDALLGDQLDSACVAQQLRRQEDDDVFDVFSAIAGGVLSFEIGVDRHLRDGASTNGVDEVDGCGAALRSNDIQC